MRYAIGIDLGGTKTEGVLIGEDGKLSQRERILTEADRGRKVVLSHLLKLIGQLRNDQVAGVGIGIPGRIDKSGKIIYMPNIECLVGFKLKEYLEKETRLQIYLLNDASCFALAEFMFGAGKKSSNMIGIIIGTGIGSGLILKKQLYLGSRGFAGEIGHAVLKPLANTRTDVEQDSGGKYITKKYVAGGGTIIRPGVKKIYASKEKIAKQVINEGIDIFAREIAFLITSLDLDCVVLGGGISNLPFYGQLNRRVNAYLYEPLRGKVKVLKNELGDSAGVIGAASLVFRGWTPDRRFVTTI
jgi:predicted NBD/HSP70 family sugar kinase